MLAIKFCSFWLALCLYIVVLAVVLIIGDKLGVEELG
jgi:hypothetical protein